MCPFNRHAETLSTIEHCNAAKCELSTDELHRRGRAELLFSEDDVANEEMTRLCTLDTTPISAAYMPCAHINVNSCDVTQIFKSITRVCKHLCCHVCIRWRW